MYIGDFALGATFDLKFTSRAFSTGAPTTLSGTPVISAYADNGTTELTAGITLTVDFDSRTGLNNVRVVATSGNGYAAGSNYQLVITTGTVGGVSVVGEVVGQFSLEARSSLRPTTAGRTLDVTATGAAGIDWGNVENPTTALNLSGTNIDVDQVVASVSGAVASVTAVSSGAITEASFATTAGSFSPLGITRQGTAQAATASTVTLDASAAFGDNVLAGSMIAVLGSTQGYWQAATIESNVGSTDVATIEGTFPVTPSGTLTFKIFAVPPADGTAAAIKAVTDKLDGMLEPDGGSGGLYQYTPTALAEGGGSPAAIWNYDISAIVTSGLAGTKLNSASSAGDPWGTSIPGAYGAGTAGFILGTNLNATVSSRASQTSVDTVDTVVDAIKVKTDFLPSATAGAAGGVFIAGSNAATTVNFTGSLSGSVGSVTGAVGSVTGAVGSVTGNVGGNVVGSVGSVTGAVGSVTGAVGSVTGNVGGNVVGTVASVVGAVGSVTGLTASDVAAIKAKTDSLTFTTAGMVDSAVKRVGSTTLSLAGTGGQGYGG